MKTPILKAVAMPPTLFWAPMLPACINFAVQMAILVALMGAYPGKINPSIFVLTFTIVHIGLIVWGIKEPHLSTLLPSWGQARSFWDKEDKVKTGLLDIKAASDGQGIQINGRHIRVLRLNGEGTFAAEWRKWLMTMARYPVDVQIWTQSREELQIILSVREKDSYRLREAIQDSLSVLQAFQPEELSMSDVTRLWEDILKQKVKFIKGNGTFVAQNSQEYTAFVSIDRWGDETDGNLIADLLALDEKVKVAHHLQVLPSVKANALLIQQRKMAFFCTFSQQIYNQYTAALEAIDSRGEFPQVAVGYALSVRVSAKSPFEVDQLTEKVMTLFIRYGVQTIREKKLAKACYIGQFPGVVQPPRRFLMLSDNVVSLLNIPRG